MAGSLILLLLSSLGCDVPHPADPLVIPAAADIEMIEVDHLKGQDVLSDRFQIADRHAIEAILACLREHNTDYVSSVAKLPEREQEYWVALDGHGKMLTMIRLYPGWLGGVDDEHSDKDGLISRYRRLDPAQRAELLALFAKYAKYKY
jgi:hypothetical protein